MARKWDYPDFDNVREMYAAGQNIRQLAAEYGIPYITFYDWVRRNGLRLRPQSETVRLARAHSHAEIADAAVAMYRAGASELAVARRLGVDRLVIKRLLSRAGVQRRNGSEANRLRFQRMTADERCQLAAAAHAATRGKPKSEDVLHRSAITKQRTLSKVGNGERLFVGWLQERGLAPVLQLAVGRYNLDIAIHPVAVEIHMTPQNPLALLRTRQRIKRLTELGWHVLYVWVSKRHFLSKAAADDAVAFRERAKRDPSPIGKYRVIRGSGKLVAEGCADLD